MGSNLCFGNATLATEGVIQVTGTHHAGGREQWDRESSGIWRVHQQSPGSLAWGRGARWCPDWKHPQESIRTRCPESDGLCVCDLSFVLMDSCLTEVVIFVLTLPSPV